MKKKQRIACTVAVCAFVAMSVGLTACGGGSGSAGTSGGSSSTNSSSSSAAVASKVMITGGNQQIGEVATTLPTALSVQVTTSSGQALSGVSVTWAVTAGGGSLTPSSSTTDSNGTATTQWKLGTTSGTNTATATVASLAPATFSATGTPGPLASMILTNPTNPLTIGAVVTIGVTASDQYGNVIANVSPSWSATPSSVVTVASNGSVTAVDGGAGFVTATSGAITTTLPVVVNGNITFTIGPEEVVFTYTKDACESSDVPDVPAKAIRLPDGSLTLIDGDAPNNYAMFGATFSSLTRNCSAPILSSGASSSASTFDNEEWVQAVYLVGNTINALIHNEFHDPIASNCSPGNPLPGNPCWYNSILYASSIDGGTTYTQAASPGQLVAPAAAQWNPGPPTPSPYGYFSPTNIVLAADGNYYAMFISMPNSASSASAGMCLMRTSTLNDPTSWRAWDGTGFNLQMTDPYTGPAPNWCTPVIPNSEFVGTLTFNTYLGTYMLLGDVAVSGVACGTWFYTSSDLIHWSAPAWVRATYSPFSSGGSGCAPPAGVASIAYSSVIDHNDTTANFERPGQTPYLYYTRFNPTGGPLNRDLVRVPVTITMH